MGEGRPGMLVALRGFAGAIVAHAGRRGVRALSLVVAGALVEGIGIVLLVPILELVVATDASIVSRALAGAGVSERTAQLAVLLGGFVAAMAVRSLVLHARDVMLADLQAGFVEQLRNDTVAALAAARWADIARLQHARVTNLMSADLQRVAASAQYLIQAGVAAIMLLVQSLVALWLAPALGGGVILLLVIAGLVALRRAGRTRDLGGRLVGANLALMQSAGTLLGGLKTALAEGDTGRFARDFARSQSDIREHQVAFARQSSRARTSFAFAGAAAGAAVILLGTLLTVPAGTLLTLILVFARMNAPAQMLQAATQNLLFGLPSFESVTTLQSELLPEAHVTTPVEPPAGAIELDRVSFAHPGAQGLHEASITIEPGAVVGIVGASGAGKTSLIDLIAGLLEPHAGTIRVGGAALTGGVRAGWRRRIGYVPQDGYLFHDTVRRNLATEASEDEIGAALAVTGADAVVAQLPEGLATVIGERGARLSGGEGQRLAIARALLRRPRLLILDEATNALDLAAEAALLDRLIAVTPRPTILIVAHRRESLTRCDRLLSLADGRLTSYMPS